MAPKTPVASPPETPARVGFTPADLPAVFELLGRLAQATVATIGMDCEVVVHDLRVPEHSVVAISGSLTGRQVGAPIPDPTLMPGVVDSFTSDDLLRQAQTPSGRELVASTSWIRDTDGHVVGAVCVNVDQSQLKRAREIIDQRLVAVVSTHQRPLTTFASDISHFASAATREAVGSATLTHRLTRRELVSIVRDLDRAGVFSLRGAAQTVGRELGLSRASIYDYLRDARSTTIGADVQARRVRHLRARSASKSSSGPDLTA